MRPLRRWKIRPSAWHMKSSCSGLQPLSNSRGSRQEQPGACFTFLYFCLMTWGMHKSFIRTTSFRLQTSVFERKQSSKWGKNGSTVPTGKGAASDLYWQLGSGYPWPSCDQRYTDWFPSMRSCRVTAAVRLLLLLLLLVVIRSQILLSI